MQAILNPNPPVGQSFASLLSTWQSGLRGEYYNYTDTSNNVGPLPADLNPVGGVPLRIGNPRYEAINFNWGYDAPFSGVNPEDFFVRWTGVIVPSVSGIYKFQTRTDDGVRLWLNGHLVIDKWILQATTVWPAYPEEIALYMEANVAYTVKMEYYDTTAHAVAELDWQTPGSSTYVPVPVSVLKAFPLDVDAATWAQLKAAAKPFYDYLIGLGRLSGYPWTGNPAAQDSSLITAADARLVFAFPIGGTFVPPVPPALSSAKFDTASVPTVITASGVFSVTATNADGVDRVEFRLVQGANSRILSTDTTAADGWTAPFDILAVDDGASSLEIRAWSSFGLVSTPLIVNFSVELPAPDAPVFTSPANGFRTNLALLTLLGTSAPGSTVAIYQNDVAAPVATTTADGNGAFSASVTLPADNSGAPLSTTYTARARNRNPAQSAPGSVTVIYDFIAPEPPLGLTASALSGGGVQLIWHEPFMGVGGGYYVFRSPINTPFPSDYVYSAENALSRAGGGKLVTVLGFVDQPPGQGTYYYRVVNVSSDLQYRSVPSNSAEITVDGQPPVATVTFEALTSPFLAGTGASDPGTHGPGNIRVRVAFDEPLADTPFVNLTTVGGPSLFLDLIPVTDRVYSAVVNLGANLPSGPLGAAVTAVDRAGNQGTGVIIPTPFVLDNRGPVATLASGSGGALLKAYPLAAGPVILSWRLTLNEAPVAEPTVSVSCASGYSPEVDIESVTGVANTWLVSVHLPADAAISTADALTLNFNATDRLGNADTNVFTTPNTFQLYRGALPPLAVPVITAAAAPAGRVRLTWFAVSQAAAYRVRYRMVGATDFIPVSGDLPGTATEYLVNSLPNGNYEFQVASVRQENGTEAEGWGVATPDSVAVDATAPSAPSGLNLTQVPQGIQANWSTTGAPSDIDGYRLYRASTGPISSVSGLAIAAEAPANIASAIDSAPHGDSPFYALVAFDKAGNVSPPATARLDFGHLPVSTLSVLIADREPPVVSWTPAPGSTSLTGYRLAVAAPASSRDLLLSTTSFTDTDYPGGDSGYTVSTLVGDASPRARSVVFGDIVLSLRPTTDGSPAVLRRGVMNVLTVRVENRSATRAISGGELILTVPAAAGSGRSRVDHHPSSLEPLLLPAVSGSTPSFRDFEFVVGGYDDLPAGYSPVTLSLIQSPNPGENITRLCSVNVPVVDGVLRAELVPGSLLRGASGSATFRFTNSGACPIEFKVTPGGGEPDATISVLDARGEALASAPLDFTSLSFPGSEFFVIHGGASFVRVPPGATFTSPAIAFPVPASAPANVTLALTLPKVYFSYDFQDTRVELNGPRVQIGASAAETSYTVALNEVSAPASAPVSLTGVAHWRPIGTAGPLPAGLVPVVVSIRYNGFVRRDTVFTQSDGTFTYEFTPGTNEPGGFYEAWASHPDTIVAPLDAPALRSFSLQSVAFPSLYFSVSTPRNYPQRISVPVQVGRGTILTNLRAVPHTTETPFPPEIAVTQSVSSPSIGSFEAPASGQLELTFRGANAAAGSAPKGRLLFDLVSDSGSGGLLTHGVLTLDYEFVSAYPNLSASPASLDFGVRPGEVATASYTIRNDGYAPLEGATVDLVDNSIPSASVPSWIRLQSVHNLPLLAPGEETTITVAGRPPSDPISQDQLSTLKVVVSVGGVPAWEFPVKVTLSPSGAGSVLLWVTDGFTVLEPSQTGIPRANPGVVGAALTLERLDNRGFVQGTYNGSAGADGRMTFANLPVGSYKVRVSAPSHESLIDYLEISPGAHLQRRLFLNYNPVSFTWSVTPVTFEDRYDIELTTTYETEVPLPVVICEPGFVELPAMCAGQVYTGEFRLTNHGLVASENVKLPLPEADEYFSYELLSDFGGRISPGQSVRVLYKVTCIKALPGNCGASVAGAAGASGSGSSGHGGNGLLDGLRSYASSFTVGNGNLLLMVSAVVLAVAGTAFGGKGRRPAVKRGAVLLSVSIFSLSAYARIIGYVPCGSHNILVKIPCPYPCPNGSIGMDYATFYITVPFGLCPVYFGDGGDDSGGEPPPPPIHPPVSVGVPAPYGAIGSYGTVIPIGSGNLDTGGDSDECPPPPPPCRPDCPPYTCDGPGGAGGGSGAGGGPGGGGGHGKGGGRGNAGGPESSGAGSSSTSFPAPFPFPGPDTDSPWPFPL